MSFGAALFVETLARDQAGAHDKSWRALAARACEPNPFGEAAFLLPALTFLNPPRARMVFAWSDAARGALLAVMAVGATPGVLRVWRSEQAALPALLLDRERGEAALAAIRAHLARAHPFAAGLAVPMLAADGAMFAAFRAVAMREGLAFRTANPRARAALPFAPPGAPGFAATLDPKRAKEWRRQRRRLGDGAALSATSLSGAAAIEAFLALEARGWKGARRTALAADKQRARFARAMLNGFDAEGRLAIHALMRDGEVAAAGLALRAPPRAFYWKTAYDERFASLSPGVLLSLDFGAALERDAQIALTDSCALPDHPMIDALWPARIPLVDCAIALTAARAPALALWQAAEALRLKGREAAKRAAQRLRAGRRARSQVSKLPPSAPLS